VATVTIDRGRVARRGERGAARRANETKPTRPAAPLSYNVKAFTSVTMEFS